MEKRVVGEVKRLLDHELGAEWAKIVAAVNNENELKNQIAEMVGRMLSHPELGAGQWLHEELQAGRFVSEAEYLARTLQDSLTHQRNSWLIPARIVEKWQLHQPFGLLFFGLPSQVEGSFFCELMRRFFADEKQLRLVQVGKQEWVLFLLQQSKNKEKDRTNQSTEWLADYAEAILEMVRSEGAFELRILIESAKWWLEPHAGKNVLVMDANDVEAKKLLLTISELRALNQLARRLEDQTNILLAAQFGLERLILKLNHDQRVEWLSQIDSCGNWETVFESERELIRTLNVVWQTRGNLSEAAKRLYVHRNTLQYRLDKIKNETGFDPRISEEAVMLRIGLLLYTMNNNP